MKIISHNLFTPNGWVVVDRLVVRVFGKEITLRTTVEKIHIPDNAFKECLHDTDEMRKMKLHRLSDEEFDLILNTRF